MRWPALARAYRALIPIGSVAVFTLFISPPVGAQSPAAPATTAQPAAGALTLAQALALAMASNAELAVAQRELAAAQGPVLQGRARPNPELSVLLEDTRQATRTSTLQFSQRLELGGQRAARIDAAERSLDMAAAALAAKQADLRATVVLAFNEAVLAQEGVELAVDTVALAQRASDAASKRVRAGKVAPIDETKARIAEAAAQLEAAQAHADLALARLRLAALWGQSAPQFERVQTEGDSATALPPVPTPQALAARLAASPHLRRAQIDVRRRHALAEIERARRVPDVTLSLGVKRDEQLGRNQALVGLSLPLPVFDSNRGNLLEAVQREAQSRDELAALGTRLHTAVMQAASQLAAANAQAAAIRDQVLPGALSAFEAATKGFELGKFNFLDVLDAQRTLFQAKSQYQRARGDALRALADIDRLLGDASAVAMPSASPSQE
jgi:outer membrane protein, heavy metal efflux system